MHVCPANFPRENWYPTRNLVVRCSTCLLFKTFHPFKRYISALLCRSNIAIAGHMREGGEPNHCCRPDSWSRPEETCMKCLRAVYPVQIYGGGIYPSHGHMRGSPLGGRLFDQNCGRGARVFGKYPSGETHSMPKYTAKQPEYSHYENLCGAARSSPPPSTATDSDQTTMHLQDTIVHAELLLACTQSRVVPHRLIFSGAEGSVLASCKYGDLETIDLLLYVQTLQCGL
ncbi:hypothetical protein K504DRAFT_302176 [Pleomassaria siparia CBS 279.74]|uniref:Uncharacterized protein n=1 Tax=Pleomassaria siparia CBS 279.74 TaxID=1314801 RepID=A0A6G1K729_9PLEO|nr:hypothetical protein K504DRAFT_302176 [Pleomassaria siparia CBS 279.74]